MTTKLEDPTPGGATPAVSMPSRFDVRVSALYDAFASAMANQARAADDSGKAWSAVRRTLDDLHARLERELRHD